MIARIGSSLKYALWATLFGLAAVFVLNIIPRASSVGLGDLPDHNYIGEIQEYYHAGQYEQATHLANYVIMERLPEYEAARHLLVDIKKKQKSPLHKGKRLLGGFLSGKGGSAEEIVGAIASDMLIVGDVRDLGIQGYNWATEQEVNDLVILLSTVGIISEIYAPSAVAVSMFKGAAKAGSISKGLFKSMRSVLQPASKSETVTTSVRALFKDGERLFKSLGHERTRAALQHADDIGDLTTIARMAEKNSDLTMHTLTNSASLGGEASAKRGVKLLETYGAQQPGVLALAARKGPAGIEWLVDPAKRVQVAVVARYGARVIKTFHLGRPQALASDMLIRNIDVIPWVWGLFSVLLFLSIFNAFRIVGVFWTSTPHRIRAYHEHAA